ncbi:hypothetical protein FB45DRAFT_1108044 [Roridomyces roridus]|uniref:Uncharacterized protein n=1 Tax=Roridomyces roridus TaxID=1738132 RepID=A0AAD7BAT2_9AGAR|nr:hypothetical protein FB45DRAFT_1108044 [Roridomyces roridus]
MGEVPSMKEHFLEIEHVVPGSAGCRSIKIDPIGLRANTGSAWTRSFWNSPTSTQMFLPTSSPSATFPPSWPSLYIAFTKTVWLALIGELRRRSMLDETRTPSDLRDLTTDDLVKLVKRLCVGPDAWSSVNSLSQPETRVIHPEIHEDQRHEESVAKLLPSGRHVIFQRPRTLQCWDVEANKLVWKYTPIHGDLILAFDAEPVRGAAGLSILICLYRDGAGRVHFFDGVFSACHPNIRSVAELIDVDLATKATKAPSINTTFCFPHPTLAAPRDVAPLVRGSLIVVRARDPEKILYQYVLFDSKHNRAILVQDVQELIFIPGYILLTLSVSNGPDFIRLICIAELESLWSPCPSFNSLREIEPNSGCLLPCLRFSNFPVWRNISDISIHADPLREDTYRLWVLHDPFQHAQSSGRNEELWCYTLVLRDTQELKWRFRCMCWSRPQLRSAYTGFTYSGHHLSTDHPGGLCCIYSPDAAGIREEVFSGRGHYVTPSVYSGAITYTTMDSIVIRYYS